MTTMLRSQSIPVSRRPEEIRIQEAEERRARMADFQDQMFYNRLVSGMKEQQSQAICKRHQQERQSLIDSIEVTRRSVLLSPLPTRNCSNHGSSNRPSSSDLKSLLAQTLESFNTDEDDLMFELDL